MKLSKLLPLWLVVFGACLPVSVAQNQHCILEDLTEPGDANRDFEFEPNDLIQVMRIGKFETGELAGWEEGDFNGDGVFDEGDIAAAFATGNFMQGPYRLVVTGTPPTPRGGAPAVLLPGPVGSSDDRLILLFGGMNPITGDTFTFGQSGGWAELTNDTAPARRCHHTLISDGQEGAILFGGFSFQRRYNDTLRFDPLTSTWTELPTTGDIPAPRCLHVAALISTTNEMLMYGGIQGGGGVSDDFFLDTSLLDLNTGRWERISSDSPPGARAGAIAVYSSKEDAVFLWGGLQVTDSTGNLGGLSEAYPNELWRFDPIDRTWETVDVTGEVPIGREDPTYFWDDEFERLYVFHGFNKTLPREVQLRDDAYILHLAELRWERLEIEGDAPEPRWRASSVLDPSSSQGWMFGGWQDFGVTNLNDMWRFDINAKKWLKTCSLTDER